jgi:hypothetical protein
VLGECGDYEVWLITVIVNYELWAQQKTVTTYFKILHRGSEENHEEISRQLKVRESDWRPQTEE